MKTDNKFDKLRSMVHQGVPLEKLVVDKNTVKIEAKDGSTSGDVVLEMSDLTSSAITVGELVVKGAESEINEDKVGQITLPVEQLSKVYDKRKRKLPADYQSSFFCRIDFTNRKPLYITASTHRRLMRIVHLMDGSKATIGSYVENIIRHHLESFREEIDTIYQTHNINPTE